MNIFLLDADLAQCAKAMPDKLIVKMPAEHCQMIAAAFAELGLGPLLKKNGKPYEITHRHHPCTIWAGSSISNVYYIARLGLELCLEYERRYHTQHGSYNALFCAEHLLHSLGASLDLTDEIFPIAIGDECRNECYKLGLLEHPNQKAGTIEQAVQCYRHYILSRKLHYACWRHCSPPDWWPTAEQSHSEHGWLSCKLTKKHLLLMPSPLFSTAAAEQAFTLSYEPLRASKAGRASSAKQAKQAMPSPDEFNVPAFTLSTEYAEIRAWLATKLSSKLPTANTIAKWAKQCEERGGDDRLRQFCVEHVVYWQARGAGHEN